MDKLVSEIVDFIKRYVSDAKSRGVIIGMSGGKDSFVVAKLCTLAVGPENVFGIIMPNGNMSDIDVAVKECELLNIKHKIIDIKKLCDETEKSVCSALDGRVLSETTTINIPPRVRMSVLYGAGATLNYLVANTSNLSETMIGYSTKWGDSVGDFAPIANLTKTEVCEMGLFLGLPKEMVLKAPDDGLSGKTDEEKIGFTYAELDNFIRNGKRSETFDKIQRMHNISEHKRKPVPKYDAGKKNYFINKK